MCDCRFRQMPQANQGIHSLKQNIHWKSSKENLCNNEIIKLRLNVFRFVIFLITTYSLTLCFFSTIFTKATDFYTNLVSIVLLQASAYLASCFRASGVNLGFTTFIGISFIISRNMTGDTAPSGLSASQEGNTGSRPLSSVIFLSSIHLKTKTSCIKIQI